MTSLEPAGIVVSMCLHICFHLKSEMPAFRIAFERIATAEIEDHTASREYQHSGATLARGIR